MYSLGLASFVVLEFISLLRWIATGSSRKSMWERLGGTTVSWAWWNVTDFMPGCRYTRPNGRIKAQGSALTRNVARSHGSKNLLQRVILYKHEKIFCVREDCRPRPKKTICTIRKVFHWYFWINVFVWARVFCGPRIHQSASLGCNGVTRKILVRKIRWRQGLVSMMQMWQMSCPEAVIQGQMDVSKPRGPRWRAMLQDHMARRTCVRD